MDDKVSIRSKHKLYIIAFGLFLTVCAVFFSRHSLLLAARQSYNKWMILTMIIDKIERFYVDEKEPDALFDYAITGLLSGLDPYSRYLTSDEYSAWKKRYHGYHGVGISYELYNGEPVVVSLVEGSPAEREGIQIGDRIVQIAGIAVKGKSHETIKELLVGPQDSVVELKIQRNKTSGVLVFHLYRRQIHVVSVPCAFMLDQEIGYINIFHFTESTPAELDNAFAELRGKGMKKLVLDLRNNTGGALQAGVAVADRFLSVGKLVVFTKGRTAQSTEQYIATQENTLPEVPLVVLVNGITASDAEIVAGAIQDWDRGLIVGAKTYGKALVQSEYLFQDGSALLLTIARYYTPLGRLIQSDFVSPQNTKKVVKKYKTRKGRILTGGGGITPDFNIPERQIAAPFQTFYTKNRHLFYLYADSFVQDSSMAGTDVNFFARNFEVSEKSLTNFLRFVQNAGVQRPSRNKEQDKNLKFAIKKEIAGRLWGEKGRFMVNAFHDHQVNKSLTYFDQAAKLLN